MIVDLNPATEDKISNFRPQHFLCVSQIFVSHLLS